MIWYTGRLEDIHVHVQAGTCSYSNPALQFSLRESLVYDDICLLTVVYKMTDASFAVLSIFITPESSTETMWAFSVHYQHWEWLACGPVIAINFKLEYRQLTTAAVANLVSDFTTQMRMRS